MPKFKIYAGLSGGFGGANFQRILVCVDEDAAMMEAREMAIEEYFSYGGYHGLYTWESMKETIAEDEYDGDESQITDDEVDAALLEDIESWITYYVQEVPDDFPDDWDEDDEPDDPNADDDSDTGFYNLS